MNQSKQVEIKRFQVKIPFTFYDFKREVFYGSIAGVFIQITGHPFDTVKTH